MIPIKKQICSHKDCNQLATWFYMPSTDEPINPYYCENHVYRGCSCTDNYVNEDYPNNPIGIENKDWKWVEKNVSWCHLDSKGREWPCCEYDNSETGYYSDEYQQYLEDKCKELNYNILEKHPEEKKYFIEYGEIIWSDDLIEKIEKELKL